MTSSPTNCFHKEEISLSCKPSQANERKNEKHQKEIKKLKEEIKALKLSKQKRRQQKINSPSNKTQIHKM